MLGRRLAMFLLFTLLGAVLTGCEHPSAQSIENDPGILTGDTISLGYQDLRLVGPLERSGPREASVDDIQESGCADWSLSEGDLAGLLASMEEVEAMPAYKLCYYLPCWYTAIVEDGKERYNLTVSAASQITLSGTEGKRYFIAREPRDIFLLPCDCCETEE